MEVADAGAITAAASRLGVAKSIVSRRLIRLEAELGVQLLARTTRGASLTESGATFRDYAARVCSEIDVAQEAIRPDGDLRGASSRRGATVVRPNPLRARARRDGQPAPRLHIADSSPPSECLRAPSGWLCRPLVSDFKAMSRTLMRCVSDSFGKEQQARVMRPPYSTVTLFARFRGLSTSVPRAHAV